MNLKDSPAIRPVTRSIERLSVALYYVSARDDRSTVMRQSIVWSRNIVRTIIGSVLGILLWACLATMEEVVHTSGKLEPSAAVQDVQAPVAGTITKILIKEGERVRAGQPLLGLDDTVAASRLNALREQLESVRSENAHYTAILKDTDLGLELAAAKLPEKIAGLARDRAVLRNVGVRLQALIASPGEAPESGRLRPASLDAPSDLSRLPEEERTLLREAAKDKEEKIRSLEITARRAQSELSAAMEQLEPKQMLLQNTRKIFESYQKLLSLGGVAEVDFLERQAQMLQAEADLQRLKGLLPSLRLEKDKAEEAVVNFTTNYRRETMLSLGDNRKALAEIDSRLSKAILDNTRRISELESNLAESQSALEHHEILAPADGVIFELPFNKPGNVVATKDTVVKIVPDDELIAKLAITNKDIGFISPGQSCELEVESFPSREYGLIKSTLTFIGSDVLPPTAVRPYFAFPAKVKLETQSFSINGKTIPLQSGMAVTGKIKTRERRVIYLVLDLLLGPLQRKGNPSPN
jgi:HlyD family secretion protein